MLEIFDVFLWIGIVTLLIGYIFKFHFHKFRMIGFSLIGIFWVGEVPYYIYINDYVNASLSFLALPLFVYFAYHEYLSKKWNEDPEVMKFLAGSISIASLIYFGVQRIPAISGFLIRLAAEQTTWMTDLMGYSLNAGAVEYAGNPLFYRVNHEIIYVPIEGSGINIILACTALQTLAAAGALLYVTKAERIVKIKSMLLVLPTIYLANIFRNAMVIYLTNEGIVSFDLAHNEIAKTGSVILLIVLLLLVFEMMPQFHENIMSVITLYKREPIHQKQQK
ncbi:MAG: archaeosortase A [Thermoplasmatota archaeon]